MKKNIVLLLISLILITFSLEAKNLTGDINIEDIPKSAKFIIDNHFDELEIASITFKEQEKNYLVKFNDGKRILFNAIGDWLMIDCKNEQIPLLLVPSWIRNNIAKKFGPYTYAICISKIKRKVHIKLSNQVELVMQ